MEDQIRCAAGVTLRGPVVPLDNSTRQKNTWIIVVPRQWRRWPGFTITDLLAVITVLAIMAVLLFPLFAAKNPHHNRPICTSQLHDIAVSLKLYKDDHNGAYPEALYGFVDADTRQEVNGLYPQYNRDKQSFRCPKAPYRTDNTRLVLGRHPTTGFSRQPNRLYPVWDSYDGQFEPLDDIGVYAVKYVTVWEPKETRKLGRHPQLHHRNPPEDTVVTWCTYHRDYRQGELQPGSIDLVLFLSGNVRPRPSDRMHPITTNGIVQPGRSYLVNQGD